MKRGEKDDPFDVLFDGSLDDEVFRALSDVHRRTAVYYLLEVGETSFEELLDVVTGWLHVGDGRMTTPADRVRIERAFHHQHLPRLVEASLVRYDAASRRVELAALSEPERALVELIYHREFEHD